jgi:hypothetical protein
LRHLDHHQNIRELLVGSVFAAGISIQELMQHQVIEAKSELCAYLLIDAIDSEEVM